MAEDTQANFEAVLNRLLEPEQEVVGAPPTPVVEEDEGGLSSLLSGIKGKAGDLFEWYKRFSYPELPDQKEDVLSDIQIPPEKPTAPPIPDWRQSATIQSIIENDPIIGRIIQAESSGDPRAESKDGARGLMQIMPATAENEAGYGVNYILDREELYDPVKNVQFGTKYYQGLRDYFGNDYHALVAYHDGPGDAEEWIKDGAKWEDLGPRAKIYITNILGEQKHTGGMISRNPYPHNPRPI